MHVHVLVCNIRYYFNKSRLYNVHGRYTCNNDGGAEVFPEKLSKLDVLLLFTCDIERFPIHRETVRHEQADKRKHILTTRTKRIKKPFV